MAPLVFCSFGGLFPLLEFFDCTLLRIPIPREVLLHHRLSAPFARLCWHSHCSGLRLLGVLRPLLSSATFQMMVRQDRGFDPNLVDLFSCRLLRNDRDEFSVSFQNTRSFFEIFISTLWIENSAIPLAHWF